MKPKGLDSNWVKYEDVEFLIDYMDEEQEEDFQNKLLVMAGTQEEGERRVKLLEVAKYYLRCVIKDWKIKDDEGEEVEFKSQKGLVDKTLFYNVIGYDFDRVFALYNDFTKKLSFNSDDKKK